MKQKKTITSYVYRKDWDDGIHKLIFQMNDYTRNRLMAVPDGTYIEINQSKNTDDDDAPYYMNYEVKGSPGQPQQQQQAVTSAPDDRQQIATEIRSKREEIGLSGMQVSQIYNLPAENPSRAQLSTALIGLTELHTAWHNGQLTDIQKAIIGVKAV